MTHCFNPDCPEPVNPEIHRFCQTCGWRLRLGDRYDATQPLGSGSNSRTFLGRDRTTLTKPQCLIKRFTATGNTRLELEAATERFRKDMVYFAIASRHPQIPNLLAYFERSLHLFMVQDFLVGSHLDQVLQAKLGPFDSIEVIAFLQDVLPILQHLHRHNIIHRDIKPTNFRRPIEQSQWQLVDLGVIKPLTATRMAQPGTVVGDAAYIAPEQLRGEATFASDLYSLGIICLRLLTNLQPFDLFDGVHGDWRWRSIVPDVDDRLAAAVDKMIQPSLRDRVATVDDLMNLLNFINPTAIQPPPLPPRRTPQWATGAEFNLSEDIRQSATLPTANALFILTAEGNVEVRSLTEPTNHLDTLASNAVAIATHPQQPILAIATRPGTVELVQLTDVDVATRPQNVFKSSIVTALPLTERPNITQLTFASDNTSLIAATNQGKLYLWDTASQPPDRTWQGHTSAIKALALSHSGDILATGDTQGQVKLWHLPTHECLRTLSSHAGAITALCWLANDQALVTAGWDVSVRWRDPHTGGILQSVQARGFALPVRSLLAHPTQPTLITGSQDGHLHCWPGPSDELTTDRRVEAIAAAPATTSPIISLQLVDRSQTEEATILCVTQPGQLMQFLVPIALR